MPRKSPKGSAIDDSTIGKCCVYIMHFPGITRGIIHPTKKCPPTAMGVITAEQANQLTAIVQAKLLNFIHKNGDGS